MADLRRLAGATGHTAKSMLQAADFAESVGNAALAAAIRNGTASVADVRRAVRDSFLQSQGITPGAPPAGLYEPPNIRDKPASREVPAPEPTLDERIDFEPNVRETVRENLPAISAANPELAKRILAGDPGANAQAYRLLADAGGDIPPPPPPEIRDLIPSRERPKPQVWIQPSGVVGPTPSPIGLPGYPIGPGVPIGAPAGRQGQLRLPLTARGPGVPVGGPLVPDWMALRPEDVIAPPRSAPGLPGPTVATPRTQQFGPGVGVNLTTRGTPSSRPVRDVTSGGTGVAEDVMASPVQGTEIDFSGPVASESLSMSIPSEFTVANDISAGSGPARQRFLGDVSASGRQPSAIDLDGNAPFGWPGADARLGGTTDINPTSGMGDIYEVTPEPGAAAFRSDDPALTTMGDLQTLDNIALDTAQLDDLIPTLERPQGVAPQVAEEVAKAAEETVQASASPSPPSPTPSAQAAIPSPAQPPGPPLPQWARAPITNRILRGGRGAANNYGGDIGIALGLTGLGAGLYSTMTGESHDPIPAPPGHGASADDDAQQAEDAAMSQASVAANESLILPPQETVDPVPLESLAGAPEFDVGTPELGEPPVEILGSIMAAADSFMPEDSDPSPQAEEQLVPGPELAGRELGDAIMKLNREFDRGSITPEAAMTDPVYSRIPGDKLRRLVARGQDLAERQYRRKQAGIFSATNPYGRATQLAAAMYALAPEDRDAFMAHYTLGGPPGQVVSYMDARRDRESKERVRGQELASEEARARTAARGVFGSAAMNTFGQLGSGYYQAMGAMQAARAQLARIQAEMRAAEQRHQEAMQRGDAQEAAESRRHLERMEEDRRQTTILGARAGAELAEAQSNASRSPQQMAYEGVIFGEVGQNMRAAAQRARDGSGWRRPLPKDNARGILYRTFPGYTADVYEQILADVYDGPVATN